MTGSASVIFRFAIHILHFSFVWRPVALRDVADDDWRRSRFSSDPVHPASEIRIMTSLRFVAPVALLAMAFVNVRPAVAQAPAVTVPAAAAPATTAPAGPPPAYGEPIKLEAALKVLSAAKEEADKQGWPVAIAVVDGAGHLVAFTRLDNTQYGSVDVSIAKAKSAALFRRPTKVFEDILAGGGAGLRILKLEGAMPLDGGLPIMVDGRIVGGIGVSGVQSAQDAQVGAAGLAALK
jgi:glc operon protein GlcG